MQGLRFVLWASIAACSTLSFAATNEWFDAKIGTYRDWPTDGAAKTVEDEGEWEGTENASLIPGDIARLRLESESDDGVLSFIPAHEKTVDDGEIVYDISVRLTLTEELPQPVPEGLVAITALGPQDGNPT